MHWMTDLRPSHLPDGVRLWLPFSCLVNGQPRAHREVRARETTTLELRPRAKHVGRFCSSKDPREALFCSLYLEPDWWFISDPQLADGFSQLFDKFNK